MTSKRKRWSDPGRKSAAASSVRARRCPSCKCTDALRIDPPDANGTTLVWCRFCTFTETKGRNAV